MSYSSNPYNIPFIKGKPVLTLDQMAERDRNPKAFREKYFPKVDIVDDSKKPRRKSDKIQTETKTRASPNGRRKSSEVKRQYSSNVKKGGMTVEEKLKMINNMKNKPKPERYILNTNMNQKKQTQTKIVNQQSKKEMKEPNEKYDDENEHNNMDDYGRINDRNNDRKYDDDSSEDFGYGAQMMLEEELNREGEREDEEEWKKIKRDIKNEKDEDDDY